MCAPRPWPAAPSSSVQGKPHCGEMPAIARSRHRGARAASRGPPPPGAPPTAKGRQPTERLPGARPARICARSASPQRPAQRVRGPAQRSGEAEVSRESQG